MMPTPRQNFLIEPVLKRDGVVVTMRGDELPIVIPILAHEVFHWFGLTHVPFRSSSPVKVENLMTSSTA